MKLLFLSESKLFRHLVASLIITVVFLANEADGSGYSYLGCFTDMADSRDMGAVKIVLSSPSVTSCAEQCASQGYPFAGLQEGNICYCDMSYGTYGRDDTACNYTCDVTNICGGVLHNSVYYTITVDVTSIGQRKTIFKSTPMPFNTARQECVKMNGDLAPMDTIASSNATASSITGDGYAKVYIGLARVTSGLDGITSDYQWTYRMATIPYSRNAYEKDWADSEQWQNDCVVLLVAQQKWLSVDCMSPYPFVCIAIPQNEDYGETTDSSSSSEDDGTNRLALFIVLPIMLTCFVGSCVSYGVYRLVKMCRKKQDDDKLILTDIENHNVPSNNRQPQNGKTRRPFSGRVTPAMVPLEVRESKNGFPMQSMNAAPQQEPSPPQQPLPPENNPFITRPVSSKAPPNDSKSGNENGRSSTDLLIPPPVRERSSLSPRSDTSQNEPKKQELLDNAAKEARERSARQRSVEPPAANEEAGAIPKSITSPRPPSNNEAPKPLTPPVAQPTPNKEPDNLMRPKKKQPKRIIVA